MNSNTKAYVNIIKQIERYHTMKRDLDDHVSKVKSKNYMLKMKMIYNSLETI